MNTGKSGQGIEGALGGGVQLAWCDGDEVGLDSTGVTREFAEVRECRPEAEPEWR